MSEYDRLKAVEMRLTAQAQAACADAMSVAPHLTADERSAYVADYTRMSRDSLRMALTYEKMGED